MDWNLGPIGARGWIYGQRQMTTDSRQIQITKVDKYAPADGVLVKGDVILGINGKPFTSDARKAFGAAIDVAEGDGKGQLRLIRWRAGKSANVTITLPRIGSYSDTSPWNCEKTDRIIADGLYYLQRNDIKGIPAQVKGLALLAAGDESHLRTVRKLAHNLVKQKLPGGMKAWHYGMQGIFLAEYYLATGDEAVMPRLRELVAGAAAGQSSVGTYGHGFSELGTVDGRLGGYGTVNQSGLMCQILLELGKLAGIDSQAVKKASWKGAELFEHYVDMGSVSYGDNLHAWPQSHDNNGTNGSAAIFMQLVGRKEAAQFYSRMMTASFNERETGHTGNYWGLLWGSIGAARGGPHAIIAFQKPQRWYFDLMRRPNGSFIYQGYAEPNYRPTYRNWDCTGLVVLGLSLPKKKLYLTGRGLSKKDFLSEDEVEDTVAAAQGLGPQAKENSVYYDKRSVDELMTDLASWSPVVRHYASQSLAKKENPPVVDELTKRLASKSRFEQYGACQGLGRLKGRSVSALPALLKAAQSDDQQLQIQAILALGRINDSSVVPQLLAMITPEIAEGRAMKLRALCYAIAGGWHFKINGLHHGYKPPSARGDLAKALNIMLDSPDGRSLSHLTNIYRNWSYDDLKPILPKLVETIETPAPTGIMFAHEIRVNNLNLLAKHGVAEGIAAGVTFLDNQNPWGNKKRTPAVVKTMKKYGAAAKGQADKLDAIAEKERNVTRGSRKEHKEVADMLNELANFLRETKVPGPQLKRIGK
jgi:hypothetical protein